MCICCFFTKYAAFRNVLATTKKYCKGFSQEEDFVAEKLSREIIRNSFMEDHYG
jgi:hypothetical protein